MRTVEEVRRLRLRALVEEFGTYAELNQLLDRLPGDSTFSQIANQSPDSKSGKPKTMGSDQARRLEVVCGKPVGWMDTDPDFDELVWPFGPDAPQRDIARLPQPLLDQATGMLRTLLVQASALKPVTPPYKPPGVTTPARKRRAPRRVGA